MDNIINIGANKAPADPVFDYVFTRKDGQELVATGVLTMNPLFFGVTDTDQRLVFSVATEEVSTVRRVEPIKHNA